MSRQAGRYAREHAGSPGDPAEARAVELVHDLQTLRTDEPELAGPVERLAARLIDLVCLLACLLVISTVWLVGDVAVRGGEAWEDAGNRLAERSRGAEGPRQPPGAAEPAVALWALALLGVFVTYEVGTSLRRGQTPGKQLLGLRVVRAGDGEKIGAGCLLLRSLAMGIPLSLAATYWFVALLSWLALPAALAAFFWMLRRDDRRGLHDLLAGTKVVRPR